MEEHIHRRNERSEGLNADEWQGEDAVFRPGDDYDLLVWLVGEPE